MVARFDHLVEQSNTGLLPNRSTIDSNFILRTLIEKSWEWNKPLFVAFIDLTEAFDRMPLGKLCQVLADPYYGGSVLSPSLFIILMDFVIRRVGGTGEKNVYADDISVASWSVIELQDEILKWIVALKEHVLRVNPTKIEVLAISR
ncbi:uncharacterized protein LOC143039003 [Oratosquilla oratoria]|uniref:uncharacterized protein LOC143039003 n=1 Tax=Oratosquilla oratoria TaxID=337810 RepID=UPI003F760F29